MTHESGLVATPQAPLGQVGNLGPLVWRMAGVAVVLAVFLMGVLLLKFPTTVSEEGDFMAQDVEDGELPRIE